jgi:caffeoyl-CoA O-methyltransferase
MDFIPQKISEYCENHSQAEDVVLSELNRFTHVNVLRPRMLSGHLQGVLLEMISKMIQPKSILEIGTYTGYSAISLAKGLQKDGKLITLEFNEELEELANSYFEKAGFSDKIQLIIGDALEIIPTLQQSFDLVFIDADKENYVNYFNLIIDKVPSGGYIIADNVLWSGKVADKISPSDKETIAIDSFNKQVHQDSRVENLLIPFRDGLMVLRKK